MTIEITFNDNSKEVRYNVVSYKIHDNAFIEVIEEHNNQEYITAYGLKDICKFECKNKTTKDIDKAETKYKRKIDEIMEMAKLEERFDYLGWANKLPAFHFDKEWDVSIIPPFAGAIVRFTIDYNDKHVSVYFDAYSKLGFMCDKNLKPVPYFEYYDGEETYRYYLDESEQMMNDIRNFLNN